MKAVLRVALTTFTLLPLQRWLNGVGVLLLLAGALVYANAAPHNVAKGVFVFSLLGMVVMLITPVFAGGVALRFASTRTLLQLQPHGRMRMLLGSTLAITLYAVLFALPWMTTEWIAALQGRTPTARHIPSRDMFMIGWAGLSALWICLFIFSRSAATMAFVGFVPIAGMLFGQRFQGLFPNPETIFALGLGCWLAFAFWYLRTSQVHRPEFPLGGEASMQPEAMPISRLANWLGERFWREPSREAALRQFLLASSSPAQPILMGAWIAAIFIVLHLAGAGMRGSSGRNTLQFLVVMPFIAFFTLSMGYVIARRTRYLWLRTGYDRTALFSKVEKMGLRAAMTTWLVACLPLGILSLTSVQGQLPAVGLYFLLQATLAVLVYYGGLASVRGWGLTEVLMCAGMAVLIVVQMSFFAPVGKLALDKLIWAIPPALVAILLMRAFAAHRWQSLDWRVAKMPRMTRT